MILNRSILLITYMRAFSATRKIHRFLLIIEKVIKKKKKTLPFSVSYLYASLYASRDNLYVYDFFFVGFTNYSFENSLITLVYFMFIKVRIIIIIRIQ